MTDDTTPIWWGDDDPTTPIAIPTIIDRTATIIDRTAGAIALFVATVLVTTAALALI